ncbi:MAG TPA: tetratricopeptide repeat protein [Terriglobales bacterium]
MTRKLIIAARFAFLCAIFVVPAVAQMATVQGVVKDGQGNPIPDAEVIWHNQDNGRTYNLKTNKSGKYFSLGIEVAKYTITLKKDGKELEAPTKDFPVTTDEITLDFDLKKEQEQAVQETAKKTGMTPEQMKQIQEQNADTEKYNTNIKAGNEKLKAATVATQAGDYDGAIAALTEASQMLPKEDLVWYRLGATYLESNKKVTDPAEKTKRYTEAYNDIQKAIDLKTEAMKNPPPAAAKGAAPAQGAASDNARLGGYYDNLAAAAARIGKPDEAEKAYKQAAELDPPHAAHYYLNLGLVYTNANSSSDPKMRQEAVDAFDKAITADPQNAADAYFYKGQNLMGMVTVDSNNKMTAPPGTAEAFNKYLELKPDGPHAAEAKGMLEAIGSTVQTSLGTPKKKK